MTTALAALAGMAALPVLRAIIKALRAHKATKDIIADALEAGIDAVDKK